MTSLYVNTGIADRAAKEHRNAQQVFRNLMLMAAENRNPFKKLYFWFLAARTYRIMQRFSQYMNE